MEKALKAAIMILRRKRPPKTHDLVELLRALHMKLNRDLLDSISELTPYYSSSRYPNAGLERPWENISKKLARRLVEAARKPVEEVAKRTTVKG